MNRQQKTLHVHISNLATSVNVTSSNTGIVTVSPTTVSPADAANGVTLTVTRADLANGVTITLTYSGNVKAAGATFTLAGTALDGLGHTTLNLKGSYVAGE